MSRRKFAYRVSVDGLVLGAEGRILRQSNVAFLRHGARPLPGWHVPLGPAERDLVRVALAVIAADRVSARSAPGDRALDRDLGWTRDISVAVELEDPGRMTLAVREFEALLGFMTDDTWELSFQSASVPAAQQGTLFSDADQLEAAEVCLFSGGLDSVAGLLARHRTGAGPFLAVSASGSTVRSASQAEAVRRLQERGADVRWVRVPTQLERLGVLLGPEEDSQRSRGLVFLLLGAAVALAVGVRRVVAYESGVGALNLPFASSQAGAQVARAMHPGTLCLLEDALSALGRPVRFELPFILHTKAETCRAAGDGLAELAAIAPSCDEGDGHKRQPYEHCGLCTSCLFRRVALHASLGNADPTVYRDLQTRGHGAFDLTMFETQVRELDDRPLTLTRLLELDPDVRWATRYLSRHGYEAGAGTQLVNTFRRYAAEAATFLEESRPVPRQRGGTREEVRRDLFSPAR